MHLHLCMVTFNTEVHFLLFSTFAYFLFCCGPPQLAVCYVDSIPSSLQRSDEFHLLPIIFPRFSPCAPPTRHLFPSLSTHMNAISYPVLVSLSPPSLSCIAIVARSSWGLLVRGAFAFSCFWVGFLTCWLRHKHFSCIAFQSNAPQ